MYDQNTWPAQTWPVTYIRPDQTAGTSTSQWVTIYRSDEHYTSAMGCAVEHGHLDLLAERRAAMRASFTLAWSGVLLVGLRPSRGVSRRVERPPEWTGGNEW